MDFQFITDLDLLFPIASLVLAAVTALLIGGFIPHKRAGSSSHSECGHTKDMIKLWKRSRPHRHTK
ncbi:hypothetical protein GH5_05759 [Leishmania sp. Ghana 2012 LV757]|uniref:hypothetical protein n=1 Tax=Leishmania sp. Ghana 2012 LV757 TaxID=2803181 RepID=UPI001B5CEA66|nr:hypothetical protein GH5_05759 [Leishmania sp. Ghana 2012 LV757]